MLFKQSSCQDQTGSVRLRMLLALWLLVPVLLSAATPSWWTERGVLKQGSGVVLNDYAPLNQGQLKNLARAAALEMATRLHEVGGTGAPQPGRTKSEIDLLVEFPTSAQTDDYAPVTLGQLKTVAKPFYDRLIEVNISSQYPWVTYATSPMARAADDFALANIGQAKELFAFILPTTGGPVDPGNGGISNVGPDSFWDSVLNGNKSTRPPTSRPEGSKPSAPRAASMLPAGSAENKSMSFNEEDSSTASPVVEMKTWGSIRDVEGLRSEDSDWIRRANISFAWKEDFHDEQFIPAHLRIYYSYWKWIYEPVIGEYEWKQVSAEEATKVVEEFSLWVEDETVPAYGRDQDFSGKVRVRYEDSAVKSQSDQEFIFKVDRYDYNTHELIASENFTLTLKEGDNEETSSTIAPWSEGTRVVVTYIPPDAGPQEGQSYSLTGDDSTGPRYRKIGLNGVPLSDEKPQSKDESGENAEETYVDAFSRELKHSVTDVYVTMDSSLLPLMARRDVIPEAWNKQNGLKPNEQANRPFGAGWTSNICAGIRIDEGNKAYVTDEQGASSLYVWEPGSRTWIHSREERADQKTIWNKLVMSGGIDGVPMSFTLSKKYGTTCIYEPTTLKQSYAADREKNQGGPINTFYCRLHSVEDRLGNKLEYSYPAPYTLIPSRISDPQRPGHSISITQQNGVVTALRAPGGDTTYYEYGTTGKDQSTVLTRVRRENSTVGYSYKSVSELDNGNASPSAPEWEHIGLSGITDEKGRSYTFGLELNRDVSYLQINGNGSAVRRQQLGLPLIINRVTLPGGMGSVSISGQRDLKMDRLIQNQDTTVSTQVTGLGGTYSYTFEEPSVYIPVVKDPGDEDERSLHLSVGFKKLQVSGPAGTEVYQFDPNYGMALTSARDISNNTTTFAYGDAGSGQAIGFDDPVSQTNALGQTKSFAYDAATRVMKSITDERGVTTVYQIQPGTGLRLKETISGPGGGGRTTHFEYGKNGFAGFLATRTVDASGDMPATVTRYTPDAQGRVKEEKTVVSGRDLVTTYFYDYNGNKTGVADANGNTTTFEYDQYHRLRRVNHPDGGRISTAYDQHGNLTSKITENGTRTDHVYDALNRRTSTTTTIAKGLPITQSFQYNGMNLVTREVDPRGKVTTHTYDAVGRRTKTTDGGQVTTFTYGTNSGGSLFNSSGFKPTQIKEPSGRTTSITYDKLYRPVQQTLSDGGTTFTEYDASGNVTKITDPLGRQTLTEYDCLGQVLEIKYPDNTEQKNFYTHGGQVWKSIDPLNRTTLVKYDAAGRAVKMTNAAGESVEKTYDGNGNVTVVRDPLNRQTETSYDSRNRPVHIKAPAVNGSRAQTSMEYDIAGNVIKTWDPLGYVTQTEYDGAGRALKVTNAMGQSTQSTYDANGNVLTVKDALGRTTTNTYDAFNRLITTRDGLNIVNEFTYDVAGNRTSVKDGKGNVTQFSYDKMNRVLSENYAGGNSVSYSYNAVQKVSRQDVKGSILYTYDDRDRITALSYPGGGRSYQYDDAGQLLSVTESGRSEAAVSYTYDEAGRVISETSRSLTHQYTYDDAGNRTGASYGTGRNVTTTYDALNRPATITEGGRTTTYTYDLAGRATKLLSGNGQFSENVYNALGHLKERTLYSDSSRATKLAVFHWNHDNLGNVIYQGENWPTESNRGSGWRRTEMTYDAGNRLKQEKVTEVPVGGSTPAARITNYTYDHAHNRTAKEESGAGQSAKNVSYSYNSANQLTSWNEQGVLTRTATLSYDGNGNRVSQSISSAGNSQNTTYQWDGLNRLIEVDVPEGATHKYGYDYRTRRITTQEGSTTTAIVFSGGLSLAEYSVSSPSSSVGGSAIVQYQRGPDMGGGVGGLLYSLRGGDAKFNLSNGRGDIVAQSNASGLVTWTASYEADGKRPVETGTNLDKQRGNSKDEDPTGLLNEGFRYRDLNTGVWLSRDPAGFVDGPNLYAYVRQNQWSKFDALGLSEDEIKRQPGVGHHKAPFADTRDDTRFSGDVKKLLNGQAIDVDGEKVKVDALIPTDNHGASGHGEYSKRYKKLKEEFFTKAEKMGLKPSGSAKDAVEFAEALLHDVDNTPDDFMKTFNNMVRGGKSQDEIKAWSKTFVRAERAGAVGFLGKATRLGGRLLGLVGLVASGVQAKDSIEEYNQDRENGASAKEASRTQYYRWGSLEGNTPEEQRVVERERSESFYNTLMPSFSTDE